MFNHLTRQKNLFPLLAAFSALVYLIAVTFPLINSSGLNSGQISSQANNGFVSLPDERPEKKQQDFMQISEWHLFGLPISQLSSSNAELQESQLELKLQGVFFLAQHPKMGHAIIESADQVQKMYKINDQLPGGAILQAIENDKIILLRDNQQEFLELDKRKLESASQPELPTGADALPEAEPEPEPAAE